MHLWRQLRSGAVVAASVALLLLLGTGSGSITTAASVAVEAPAATAAPATAAPATAAPATPVGALFLSGLESAHSCTASVVDSPAGDVVVTAAHCLDGLTSLAVFAPGYHDGVAPFGTWAVTAAYVDPRWSTSRDPETDYAFLIVAPTSAIDPLPIQRVVGADVLATRASEPGEKVTVEGYAAGIDDVPLTCTASLYLTEGYPAFECAGFVNGTSGSPWVADYDPVSRTGLVVGVIGGLEEGGLFDDESYSSPFDAATRAVYQRAATHAAPDPLP